MEIKPPEALKNLRQWHHWRLVNDSKIPYQLGEARAKSNDPETWDTFDDATESLRDDRKLAFELGSGGIIGIDLDDAFDDDGSLRPWALEIYQATKDFAYWEYSPSETGVKGIIFGEKPEGLTRSVYQHVGPGKQAVEIYDKNRFWAFTGDVVSDELPSRPEQIRPEAVEMLEHLMRGHRAASKAVGRKTGQITRGTRKVPQEPSEGLSRANAYSAKIPHAEGSRNNNLYELVHHCRSFGLSEGESRGVCNRWNDAGLSPIDPDEFDVTFDSAWSGVPFEDKEDRPMEQVSPLMPWEEEEDSEVRNDLIQEYLDAQAEELARKADRDAVIDWSGILDGYDFFDYFIQSVCETNFEYRPEYGVSAAFTILSCASARGFVMDDRYDTDSRIYSVTVGPTGSGKNLTPSLVKSWTEGAGMDSYGFGIQDQCAGYVQFVRGLLNSPTCCFMLDEFAEKLANYKLGDGGPTQQMLAVMKSSYSVSGKWFAREQTGRDARMVIESPRPVVNAMMTPDGLAKCSGEQTVETGVLGRFLLFSGPEKANALTKDSRGHLGSAVPEEWKEKMQDRLREMFISGVAVAGSPIGGPDCPIRPIVEELFEKGGPDIENLSQINVTPDTFLEAAIVASVKGSRLEKPDVFRIPVEPEARDYLDKHFEEINMRNSSDRGNPDKKVEVAIWGRATEKYSKVAMLLAISRHVANGNVLTVSLRDAETAVKLVKAMTQAYVLTVRNSSQNEFVQAKELVCSYLRTAGNKGLRWSVLVNKTKHLMPKFRDAVISDLTQSKIAIRYMSKTGIEYITCEIPDERHRQK